MEEDDDDSLRLLSNCEKGLPPVGFESVDDVAMQSSGTEDGLGFPNDQLAEGPELSLAGSSISADECVEFSPASASELGSHDGFEFEEFSQDEVRPDAKPYHGVDMQPWFNKRKPLEEQGQGLVANVFCFFAKLPRQLRRAIGTAVGTGSGAVVILATRCCQLAHKQTVLRIFTDVERNNWIPCSKVKRHDGRRRRVATQTEEAPGRGKILIQRGGSCEHFRSLDLTCIWGPWCPYMHIP